MPPQTPKLTIALITPWFGPDLKGGAEQQAWQVATRLAGRGHDVDVLTTCCRSFQEDWAVDHYPSGLTREQNLNVRRFRVDSREREAFETLNAELLSIPRSDLLPGVPPVDVDAAGIWTRENINSTALQQYLSASKNRYDAFLFLPYLYGPILNGLPLVADRAVLQPCLHDEAYAYLPDVAAIFFAARQLFFNSQGEMEVASRLYGPCVQAKGLVVGEGVEPLPRLARPADILPASLRRRCFVLCLGRRDTGKGIDLLIAAFKAYRSRAGRPDLALVLAGPGDRSYADPEQDILDLGLVDQEMKTALLLSCLALFQPSTNESFSRVMYEAWSCGKPVMSHKECLATSSAVKACEGGWTAGTEEEWADSFQKVAALTSEQAQALGGAGRAYAREMAEWDPVMERYEARLSTMVQHVNKMTKPNHPAHKLKRIDQVLPNLSYGDAISNHALWIRDILRQWGYASEIRVCHIDPRVRGQCKKFNDDPSPNDCGIIYHHSIGCELTPLVVAHPGPKAMIYHNITPGRFFRPWSPEFAVLLDVGRKQLAELADTFALAAGDSSYNAAELEQMGFPDSSVLPICISPAKWSVHPDPRLMKRLQDGKRNLLFVSRVAPNKCQHHLLDAFAEYLTMDPHARLILIGLGNEHDPYMNHLHTQISRYGLHDAVELPGHITDEELLAYFRTAHLFWSMSEHEGFGVPLVEAMWFDIPVLAYKCTAIPETLHQAGVLFTEKSDFVSIAALAKIMVHDQDLRHVILQAQKDRREDFLPRVVTAQLKNLVTKLEGLR